MARRKEMTQAIKLRKQGLSYSQIKTRLGVSKSTLSGWLKDMPLSKDRLDVLQRNERVIEKIRATKLRKKLDRRSLVQAQVARDITTSDDQLFVAGFYLYWGEGTKTAEYSISLTNSDPSMVRCFIKWLDLLKCKKEKIRVKLHLYADQDEKKLRAFWSDVTDVPVAQFYKSYYKPARSDRKTYKGMFSYGTCVVSYGDRDTYEYVLEGIQYLRTTFAL